MALSKVGKNQVDQSASLTVDSDLTVDTNTLYVDSTNNRVGIGTTTHYDSSTKLTVEGRINTSNGTAIGSMNYGGGSVINMGSISNHPLQLMTNNTTRAIIDTSGFVGIGHSTPQFGLTMAQGSGDASRIGWEDGSNSKRASIICSSSSDALQFHTGTSDTERMRLTSDGSLFYGTTSNVGPGSLGVAIDAGDNFMIRHGISGTATQDRMRFYNSNGLMGWIQTTGSACTYNSASDYRLKENVTADWDATTRLKQLNPVRFNFTFEPDTTVDGFLAHEVQSVVPEAISGTHNEVDDEGNSVYQGIDQSKLVPLLVKTIQELEARIAALEAN